jgi:hypothetical protein
MILTTKNKGQLFSKISWNIMSHNCFVSCPRLLEKVLRDQKHLLLQVLVRSNLYMDKWTELVVSPHKSPWVLASWCGSGSTFSNGFIRYLTSLMICFSYFSCKNVTSEEIEAKLMKHTKLLHKFLHSSITCYYNTILIIIHSSLYS